MGFQGERVRVSERERARKSERGGRGGGGGVDLAALPPLPPEPDREHLPPRHHLCSHVTALEPVDCLTGNKRTQLTAFRSRALVTGLRFGGWDPGFKDSGFRFGVRRQVSGVTIRG